MATVLKGEGAVIEALRGRFPPPAWALLSGVMNGTGRHASRTVDALGMSLYPSRGLELVGFEVKVTRSDWLRELGNPEKAEAVGSYCDRWFIAAGAKDLVKVEELPGPWGLLVPHGKTMKIVKDAGRLDAKPLDRKFLAAILRRVSEQRVDPAHLNEIRAEEATKAEKFAASDLKGKCQRLERAHAALLAENKQLREVAPALGGYSAETVKGALDILNLLTGWRGLKSEAKHALTSARGVETHARQFAEKLEEVSAFARKLTEGLRDA